MKPLISVAGLCVDLGGRPVVRDVSFAAAAGAVTALLGPNGAGKSTVLRALLGLVPWRAGAAQCGDIDLRRCDQRQRARLLAYVPQRSRLQSALSVRAVVAMGRFAHQGFLARASDTDRLAIDQALALTDSAVLAGRPFTELSCGEQQRVLLARALATGASAILLDEPTAALDIGHRLAVFALIRRLADEGRCIVLVLHQLDEVRGIAQRAVLLHQGAVLGNGTVDEVLTPAALRTAYGVEPLAGGGYALATPASGASP